MTQTTRLVSVSQPHGPYAMTLREDAQRGTEITPEEILIHIARVSSSRKDTLGDYEGLIRYLIRNQHWSPFEHTFCTFEIETSLPIATQYLRHRSFTFQQFSQRYAQATGVMPVELRLQAEVNRQSSTDVVAEITVYKDEDGIWTYRDAFPVGSGISVGVQAGDIYADAVIDCLRAYEKLIDLGIAKECARMVLPQATATKLYMTGNLRSWIHLVGLREDSHAQKEAQEIALSIKKVLIDTFPITSNALGWT